MENELKNLIEALNNLSAKYPMTQRQRDDLGNAVMSLMALHARISGVAYGDSKRRLTEEERR